MDGGGAPQDSLTARAAASLPAEHREAFEAALRGRVVDLGAGPGSSLDPASAVPLRSLAAERLVEVDREMSVAPDSPLRVCADLDGATLPFDAAVFDVVVCNHVLEHLHHPGRLVAEIARVLRPDGFLVAAVPNGRAFSDRLFRVFYSVFHRDPATADAHVQRFTKRAFVDLLGQAEFTPLALSDMGESYSWLHKHAWLQGTLARVTALLRRLHNDTFLYGWHVVARR